MLSGPELIRNVMRAYLEGIHYYKTHRKWMKIYEANRETVKNPNYIYIGQKLMIPPDERANM